jgi:hypothetical protein
MFNRRKNKDYKGLSNSSISAQKRSIIRQEEEEETLAVHEPDGKLQSEKTIPLS